MLVGCGESPTTTKKAEPLKPPPMPAVYQVKLETTKGDIIVDIKKEWAPRAAERFYELVNAGYYDEAYFYRTIRNFIAQFGVHRDPKQGQLWRELKFADEPLKISNKRGTLAFAHNGPHTRSTQVFISLRDNSSLDKQSFVPFGRITSGLDIADKLYFAYGELSPKGGGPDGIKAETQGNAYLDSQYPRLDKIRKASIVTALPQPD